MITSDSKKRNHLPTDLRKGSNVLFMLSIIIRSQYGFYRQLSAPYLPSDRQSDLIYCHG